jgi:hypothetical protein
MDRNRKLTAGVGVLPLAGLGVGLGLAWPLTGGPVTGTETFSGTEQMTSAQVANPNFNPTIPLTASGLFSDRGHIYLGGGNGAGPASIKLANGDVNLFHAKTNPNIQPRLVSGCTYAATENVDYTVTGGTGAYSNITGGKGIATVTFTFTMPKLAPAKIPPQIQGPGGSRPQPACANPNNPYVNPVSGGASFRAVGPIMRSSS